ncbi:MAG: amidohydrolase, partial [Bacteroidales bacterium]|nr:amidohydrolase [Bacteroidales bacterium]
MNDLMEILKTCSSEYFLDTIRLRRQIHQYPELSGHEHITARYICSTLKSYGIPSHLYLNETAVVAILEGQENTGKTLALRADTDALPIEEQSDKTYASTNKGIMHACGHDAHIASLLTVARILNQHKNKWKGKIALIFQPSEEEYPGGAIRLIKEGILTNYQIDAALALHVSPEIDTGKIGIKAGEFMAST